MLTSLSVETLPLELRPLIHAASPTIHITRSQKKKKKKTSKSQQFNIMHLGIFLRTPDNVVAKPLEYQCYAFWNNFHDGV